MFSSFVVCPVRISRLLRLCDMPRTFSNFFSTSHLFGIETYIESLISTKKTFIISINNSKLRHNLSPGHCGIYQLITYLKNILAERLLSKSVKTEKMELHFRSTQPEFHARYKIILETTNLENYLEALDWLNKHTAYSVDMKIIGSDSGHLKFYFAFEDDSDALIFKIRYM